MIALLNKYSEYLETKEEILNVRVETECLYFTMKINENEFNFMIIPTAQKRIPNIFLYSENNMKKTEPHMLKINQNIISLCLSVKEDIGVIFKNENEIIDYTLYRIKRLLTMTDKEKNREFRSEFLYYWNKVAEKEIIYKTFLKAQNRVSELEVVLRKKENKVIDYIIKSKDIFLNDYMTKDSEVIEKGLFIPLINTSEILPPLDFKPWSMEEIKNILRNCISEENFNMLSEETINKESILIIFYFLIPNILPLSLVVKLYFSSNEEKCFIEKMEDAFKIEYIKSERYDTAYLNQRIGSDNSLKNKKILAVGCGSLGSYIIEEIPKMGILNIDLVDNDKLKIDNILRHRLGRWYVGDNKAFAMSFDLKMNYPEININYFEKDLTTENIKEFEIDKYDLVLIMTGGTDFQLELNKKLKKEKYKTKFMFCWIEPNGTGVHAILIDYAKKGCFNCLYKNSTSNKVHFYHGDVSNVLTGTGCNAVFNSYGNITLLKGTAMIISKIDEILHGKDYEKNPVFSVKTFDDKQHWENKEYLYIDEECETCGCNI